MPLTEEEIRLIGRLTADVRETADRFRRQGTMIVAGAVVVAAIAAAQGTWFLVPVCLAFGAGIYALSRAVAKKSSPDAAAPVLTALRDAPEQIVSIAHSETSDSRRIFVHHWVTVNTADATLRVRADDWQELMSAIGRRCPNANMNN
jgi:hypothetical protein